MAKDFEASKPIYIQIAEQVFQQIIRGELQPGDKLPSVREMALNQGVNPNTIQRTYTEMERMGVVESKRGQGTFVVEKQELVFDLKRSMQQEIIGQFVNNMKDLGFTKKEMIVSLQEFLDGGDDN